MDISSLGRGVQINPDTSPFDKEGGYVEQDLFAAKWRCTGLIFFKSPDPVKPVRTLEKDQGEKDQDEKDQVKKTKL